MYLTSLNRLLQDPKTAQRVADAVEYATGLRLQDYNTKSRLRHLVLARALFAYYGTREHLEPIYIAELLNRERTATLYFTKRHDEEAQQSRLFAKVSADVREYLDEADNRVRARHRWETNTARQDEDSSP